MTQRGFAAPLVLIVVLLLLVAGGAYYLGRSGLPAPSPISQSISPAPNNQTADWKTYTNARYGFSFKYPSSWLEPDVNPGKMEFTGDTAIMFSSSNMLVLVGPSQPITPLGRNVNYEETIDYYNQHYPTFKDVKIAGVNTKEYEEQATVAVKGGTVFIKIPKSDNFVSLSMPFYDAAADQNIFDQILSTFRFIEPASGPRISPTPQATKLTYYLPPGWRTTQDKSGKIEIGYDPATVFPGTFETRDLYIFLMPKDGGAYTTSLALSPYDGGSRHKFINPYTWDIKLPTYHEKNYLYNGWSCLVIYGASSSQGKQVNGMCAVGNNQALSFDTQNADDQSVEQILRTIRILK